LIAAPSDRAAAGVCVVGSLNVDVVVRAPRLPQRGETVIGASCETFLGGKGFNQAIAAARAGAVTWMVGALGDDDHGQQLLRTLAAEGIDATGVQVIPDAGTGMAFPVVDDSGDNTIIVVPRANHRLRIEDVDRSGGVLGRAAVVLMQLELPVDVVVAAAASARRSGATVMLNPAPAIADARRFGGLVDVLVPNESELQLLAGNGAGDTPDAAARLSAATGAHTVVATLGERGAYVWTAGRDFTVPGHRVDAVDTVGAGDAFCGVLAARLAGGADVHDAVRYANAAGALATTCAGAEPSMPSREAVEQLVTAAAPTT
jgi:ribokinase